MIFMTTKANNALIIRSLRIHRAMCHAISEQEIFKRCIVFVTVETFRFEDKTEYEYEYDI